MNKLDGLVNLQGSLCPECGYLHPVPPDGICPVANSKKVNQVNNKDNNLTNLQHTNESVKENKIEVDSKLNIELTKIKNVISKMIIDKYNSITFSNDYVEDKFFKNINSILEKNLQEYLNEFDC